MILLRKFRRQRLHGEQPEVIFRYRYQYLTL